MSIDPKWKKFEKLIAIIHQTEQKGAKVVWNEVINGRQFDVTIRFKLGFYEYFVVIESKDQSSPVPVADVEAFVTKSHDVGANKVIMVSSSGFQSGAKEVAIRHNMELFNLSEIDELPDELLSDEIIPALNIYDIKFKIKGKKAFITLPENKNLPEYLMKNLILKTKKGDIKLSGLIQKIKLSILESVSDKENIHREKFHQRTIAYFPHLCEEYAVEQISFKYKVVSARRLKEHSSIDAFFLGYKYQYENVLTSELFRIKRMGIDTDYETNITPGKFYLNPELEFSYYCTSVIDNTVNLILIESYQHGQLIQAVAHQDIEIPQKVFVEITDPLEIKRLKRVGEKIFKDQGIIF